MGSGNGNAVGEELELHLTGHLRLPHLTFDLRTVADPRFTLPQNGALLEDEYVQSLAMVAVVPAALVLVALALTLIVLVGQKLRGVVPSMSTWMPLPIQRAFEPVSSRLAMLWRRGVDSARSVFRIRTGSRVWMLRHNMLAGARDALVACRSTLAMLWRRAAAGARGVFRCRVGSGVWMAWQCVLAGARSVLLACRSALVTAVAGARSALRCRRDDSAHAASESTCEGVGSPRSSANLRELSRKERMKAAALLVLVIVGIPLGIAGGVYVTTGFTELGHVVGDFIALFRDVVDTRENIGYAMSRILELTEGMLVDTDPDSEFPQLFSTGRSTLQDIHEILGAVEEFLNVELANQLDGYLQLYSTGVLLYGLFLLLFGVLVVLSTTSAFMQLRALRKSGTLPPEGNSVGVEVELAKTDSDSSASASPRNSSSTSGSSSDDDIMPITHACLRRGASHPILSGGVKRLAPPPRESAERSRKSLRSPTDLSIGDDLQEPPPRPLLSRSVSTPAHFLSMRNVRSCSSSTSTESGDSLRPLLSRESTERSRKGLRSTTDLSIGDDIQGLPPRPLLSRSVSTPAHFLSMQEDRRSFSTSVESGDSLRPLLSRPASTPSSPKSSPSSHSRSNDFTISSFEVPQADRTEFRKRSTDSFSRGSESEYSSSPQLSPSTCSSDSQGRFTSSTSLSGLTRLFADYPSHESRSDSHSVVSRQKDTTDEAESSASVLVLRRRSLDPLFHRVGSGANQIDTPRKASELESPTMPRTDELKFFAPAPLSPFRRHSFHVTPRSIGSELSTFRSSWSDDVKTMAPADLNKQPSSSISHSTESAASSLSNNKRRSSESATIAARIGTRLRSFRRSVVRFSKRCLRFLGTLGWHTTVGSILVVLYVIMTVHLVIGVVLADVCVDVPNVLSQVEALVDTDLVTDYIQFHTTCEPGSITSEGEYFAQAYTAADVVVDFFDDLLTTDTDPEVKEAIESIQDIVAFMITRVEPIGEFARCGRVHDNLIRMLNALCGPLYEGAMCLFFSFAMLIPALALGVYFTPSTTKPPRSKPLLDYVRSCFSALPCLRREIKETVEYTPFSTNVVRIRRAGEFNLTTGDDRPLDIEVTPLPRPLQKSPLSSGRTRTLSHAFSTQRTQNTPVKELREGLSDDEVNVEVEMVSVTPSTPGGMGA